jgi:pyruvate/2-oxoglutarate/acetoin dehydrogenase E1 component
MLKTEQFYELDEDIIELFREIEKEFCFPLNIKFVFQSNNKLKKVIEIKKLADNVAVLLNAELIVTVNEDYYNKMDDEIRRILFEQEMNKIEMNFEKGTIKLSQPAFKSSIGIIKKFSYEKVERANEAERLLVESKKSEE